MKTPRWVIQSAVILTALLCLGPAGYRGQVWWAGRVATEWVEDWVGYSPSEPCLKVAGTSVSFLDCWRLTPWWGELDRARHLWVPRRTYFEFFKRITGVALPDAPATCGAWFKAHPHLVWDEKLNRLVDTP